MVSGFGTLLDNLSFLWIEQVAAVTGARCISWFGVLLPKVHISSMLNSLHSIGSAQAADDMVGKDQSGGTCGAVE